MNDDFEEVRKLVALKRYEQPPEGFVDDFLAEFQQRQRQELLKRSSLSLFWERLLTYFEGWSAPTWGMAGATAMALVAGLMWMSPESDSQGSGMSRSGMVPASYSHQDLSVSPMLKLDDEVPIRPKDAKQQPDGADEKPELRAHEPFSASPFIGSPSDK